MIAGSSAMSQFCILKVFFFWKTVNITVWYELRLTVCKVYKVVQSLDKQRELPTKKVFFENKKLELRFFIVFLEKQIIYFNKMNVFIKI